jgi:hypothetical protein
VGDESDRGLSLAEKLGRVRTLSEGSDGGSRYDPETGLPLYKPKDRRAAKGKNAKAKSPSGMSGAAHPSGWGLPRKGHPSDPNGLRQYFLDRDENGFSGDYTQYKKMRDQIFGDGVDPNKTYSDSAAFFGQQNRDGVGQNHDGGGQSHNSSIDHFSESDSSSDEYYDCDSYDKDDSVNSGDSIVPSSSDMSDEMRQLALAIRVARKLADAEMDGGQIEGQIVDGKVNGKVVESQSAATEASSSSSISALTGAAVTGSTNNRGFKNSSSESKTNTNTSNTGNMSNINNSAHNPSNSPLRPPHDATAAAKAIQDAISKKLEGSPLEIGGCKYYSFTKGIPNDSVTLSRATISDKEIWADTVVSSSVVSSSVVSSHAETMISNIDNAEVTVQSSKAAGTDSKESDSKETGSKEWESSKDSSSKGNASSKGSKETSSKETSKTTRIDSHGRPVTTLAELREISNDADLAAMIQATVRQSPGFQKALARQEERRAQHKINSRPRTKEV